MVYQDVTRNNSIPPAAKGLYAYLAALAGDKDECYPSVDLMRHDMGMSKDAFYKHIRILMSVGVVEKMQIKTDDCRFGKNVYKLTHQVYISEKSYPKITDTEKQGTELPDTVDKDANNNSFSNNSLNNNRGINYQLIADMYNDTCVSFPRLTKLSDARKKAIGARMKQYSIEDFEKLFQMAEASSFLKGQNARNWSATFDWLIKDANMAKVLDGNYTDKQPEQEARESEQEKLQREYEENQKELKRMLGDYVPLDGPFS